MLDGMTSRVGWSGDPRGLWKVWDAFDIARARMLGYWDPACPVKTGRDDVLATVYQREGQTLVALASWAATPVSVPLVIDFQQQVAVQREDKEVVILAAQEPQAWQELAHFPRGEFAGDPVAMRLGKMSPGSRDEDFSTLGPAGVCAIKDFRVLG
jgi:hypothetical protein